MSLDHEYNATLKHIIFIQSCIRRRLARKKLNQLKVQAQTYIHRRVSYKLEKRVLDLIQELEQKSREIEAKNAPLETQVRAWAEKYERLKADNKNIKNETIATKEAMVSINEFKAIQTEKETLENRYQSSLDKVKNQDMEIQHLTAEVAKLRATTDKHKETKDF